jgi:hypothetical protein
MRSQFPARKQREQLYAHISDFPEIWCGRHPGDEGEPPPLTDEERAELAAMCSGKHAASIIHKWVPRLLTDAGVQLWTAECLKAEARGETMIHSQPDAKGSMMAVRSAVEKALGTLRPSELAEAFGKSEAVLHCSTLTATGADGGTLWLYNDRSNSLEAVFNPAEPEMVGQVQHLRSGIVSWVYKHGRPVSTSLSEEAKEINEQHSSEIDSIVGKTTQAILVIPFHCGGERRGVFSLVKLQQDASGFSDANIQSAEAFADVLSKAVERYVEKRVLS